jgi:PAS domain S-box-containing protein
MVDNALQNQQSLLGKQIEQLKDYAFFFIDVDGYIQTWNAGVEHLLGYAATEWIGKHTSIIFTPEDQAVSLCDAELRIAREEGSASDIRWHKKKDGTEIFANGVITAVYDPSSNLQGFTKIISDETARKRMEDSLIRANAALEQFAYAATHDLQEPLRTIGIYAQLLLRSERERLSPDGQEYLAYITSSVLRMDHLVKNLLAYARTGIENEPRVSVSLDEEFEAALSQLSAATEEAGARVTHDPLPTVAAQHSHITRLFLNLVGNAIKYRSPERPPLIHVSVIDSDDDQITISVSDNGIGFPEEHATNIFEPFTRLHAKEDSGSGVGLTICRRIVERLGGRIWAESKLEQGSTFFFTLPRRSETN